VLPDQQKVPLERLGDLLMELSFIQARSNAAKKVVDGLVKKQQMQWTLRGAQPPFFPKPISAQVSCFKETSAGLGRLMARVSRGYRSGRLCRGHPKRSRPKKTGKK
jgi:hypothetical protein